MSEPRTDAPIEEEPPPTAGTGAGTASPRARGPWTAIIAVVVMLGSVAALVAFWPEPEEDAGPKSRGGAKAAPVRVAPVARQDLTLEARYRGELDADAADIGADVAGRLTEVRVRLGDEVAKGDVIARIDATEWRRQLDEARARVRASDAATRRTATQLAAAKREQERYQKLANDQLVSVNQLETADARVDGLQADVDGAEAQLDEARARVATLREKLDDSTIEAPFDARVVDRLEDAGAYVQPGAGIVRLVATGQLRVRFEVPEQDITRVRSGASMVVRVPADPTNTARGHVAGIGSEVDRSQRIVHVEGTLDERPDTWLPGMYVEVVVQLSTLEDTVVVPAAAVLERPDDNGAKTHGVFVLNGATARWTRVEVLGQEDDIVAVSGAVQAGKKVLIDGHHGLKDGSEVTIAADKGRDGP